MAGSAWPDILFGVLSGFVALYTAVRLVPALRSPDRAGVPGHVTHLLMAAGMVAMFLPAVDPLPNLVWIVLFVVSGAWLITALPRSADGVFASGQGHRLHPVIGCAAMVYMFLTMGTPAPPPAVTAMGAGSVVLAHDHGGGASGGVILGPLTVAFALYFLAHAVWSARRAMQVRSVASSGGPAPSLSASRPAAAADVVMGAGMVYMFAMMLG